ncbi:hypothetical protein CsatA_020186 [Cannabis sativa]
MLSGKFEMKDLGHARKILGMEILRDRKAKTLKLSQSEYIHKVLSNFGFSDAKPVSTPIAQHFKLSSNLSPLNEQEAKEMENIPYTNLVGSIMYIMVCTRPDLSHAVSIVSRYMGNPGMEHWKAVKWLMRYLRGTTDVGLMYSPDGNELAVNGFVDSDYAGDIDTRRSQSGWVFRVNCCTISWKANLQTIVALSTTEAEYISCTEAVKEAIWLKGITRELGINQGAITILCDSQSALHLSKNQMYHERTKHIDVRLHFIRDVLAEGKVKLAKVPTAENASDMLTKAPPTAKFRHCLNLLRITN